MQVRVLPCLRSFQKHNPKFSMSLTSQGSLSVRGTGLNRTDLREEVNEKLAEGVVMGVNEIRLVINGVQVFVPVGENGDLSLVNKVIAAQGAVESVPAVKGDPTQGVDPTPQKRRGRPPKSAGRPARSPAARAVQSLNDREAVKKALAFIQGGESARVLACLAKHPAGLWDHELRKLLDVEHTSSQMGFISRACTKAGIDKDRLLTVTKKFMGRGKIAYHYQLAADAAALVAATPNFETEVGLSLRA